MEERRADTGLGWDNEGHGTHGGEGSSGERCLGKTNGERKREGEKERGTERERGSEKRYEKEIETLGGEKEELGGWKRHSEGKEERQKGSEEGRYSDSLEGTPSGLQAPASLPSTGDSKACWLEVTGQAPGGGHLLLSLFSVSEVQHALSDLLKQSEFHNAPTHCRCGVGDGHVLYL